MARPIATMPLAVSLPSSVHSPCCPYRPFSLEHPGSPPSASGVARAAPQGRLPCLGGSPPLRLVSSAIGPCSARAASDPFLLARFHGLLACVWLLFCGPSVHSRSACLALLMAAPCPRFCRGRSRLPVFCLYLFSRSFPRLPFVGSRGSLSWRIPRLRGRSWLPACILFVPASNLSSAASFRWVSWISLGAPGSSCFPAPSSTRL